MFDMRLSGAGKDGPPVMGRSQIQRLRRAWVQLLGPETHDEMQAACMSIVEDLRRTHEEEEVWKVFHGDMRTKRIHDIAILIMCKLFMNRYDARKQWFIGFMQSDLSSSSLDAASFVSKPKAQDHAPFSETTFVLLFRSMLDAMQAGWADFEREEIEAQAGATIALEAACLDKSLRVDAIRLGLPAAWSRGGAQQAS